MTKAIQQQPLLLGMIAGLIAGALVGIIRGPWDLLRHS